MNYLAHIFLSGNDNLIQIGNFMADAVKGKSYNTLHPKLQIGILLHRFIDSYTDSHPIVKSCTKILHPNYHHYSGIIIDMFFDYFLAKNWNQFHPTPLPIFAQEFYKILDNNYHLLNPRTQNILPYLKQYDWLSNYATIEGLNRILTQMDNRTQNKSKMNLATQDLVLHHTFFENAFFDFFKQIEVEAKSKKKIIEDSFFNIS